MTAAAVLPASIRDRYEMVVGLEVHVQLKTRTKAFCNCSAQFGGTPNTNTCPVCLGLPGALPVLNAQAVELAVRAAHSFCCKVNEVSIFARKNYFYPDLPKGYQITQYDRPLAEHGRLVIGERPDSSPVTIRITRVHLEEDAGKSLHDRYPGSTAIDLNRAGVPLIEIVSEPDLRSSRDAGAYLRVLKQTLEFLSVSDVNMEEGSLRVDANISARLKGETRLGVKSEVKNMNSFSGVERALEAEFVRQCGLLDAGEPVLQQTMLWDATREEVRPARSKEASHDYRYFPEPDLPPLILSQDWLCEIKAELPELPKDKRARFVKEYGLGATDLDVLTSSLPLADYFEAVAREYGDAKTAANWVMGEVLGSLRTTNTSIARFRVRPPDLTGLLKLVRDGKISHSAAKRVFASMLQTGDRPEQIAEREGLIQVSDSDSLGAWVDAAIAENPKEWERYRGGEKKLQGVFVGMIMKKSSGRADPKRINQILSERAGG
ncbi:MAG: Asp-tRNA(Asn)/Glu-tRNA(Gln) amidotransferase subunit GatB [Anaerolineae bacterium]|nr:Asp-tRNA(Asn)/Glu-tRNA(Gln) amidotransferase subunit GatB [Gemmatimonadaceae bacterium]